MRNTISLRRIAGMSLMLAAMGAGQPVGAAAPEAGDAVLGKRLFLRCAACHAITAPSPGKVGPTLLGVVGRHAGAVPGYAYSAAMQKADVVWTEANLDRWLQRPSALVPGTTMAFPGLANPAERSAIIAYLSQAKP